MTKKEHIFFKFLLRVLLHTEIDDTFFFVLLHSIFRSLLFLIYDCGSLWLQHIVAFSPGYFPLIFKLELSVLFIAALRVVLDYTSLRLY